MAGLASRICTAQGNLTLLYSQNLRFFLYNEKMRPVPKDDNSVSNRPVPKSAKLGG